MISVLITLLIFIGSVALSTMAILALFKYTMKRLGMREVQKDGVLLAEHGIEYVGFLWLIKLRADYADVESVELVPYHKAFLLHLRYALTSHWMCKRVCTDVVVIKLKGSRMDKTLFITPEDAAGFVDKLKAKIGL